MPQLKGVEISRPGDASEYYFANSSNPEGAGMQDQQPIKHQGPSLFGLLALANLWITVLPASMKEQISDRISTAGSTYLLASKY